MTKEPNTMLWLFLLVIGVIGVSAIAYGLMRKPTVGSGKPSTGAGGLTQQGGVEGMWSGSSGGSVNKPPPPQYTPPQYTPPPPPTPIQPIVEFCGFPSSSRKIRLCLSRESIPSVPSGNTYFRYHIGGTKPNGWGYTIESGWLEVSEKLGIVDLPVYSDLSTDFVKFELAMFHDPNRELMSSGLYHSYLNDVRPGNTYPITFRRKR